MSYIFEMEPYCDNCQEFEVTSKAEEYYFTDLSTNVKRQIDVSVHCKHQKRCANMVSWLEKKLEKEKFSNDDN